MKRTFVYGKFLQIAKGFHLSVESCSVHELGIRLSSVKPPIVCSTFRVIMLSLLNLLD